jgi:hypothetical protein
MNFEKYVEDRNAALLTLDEPTIRAFAKRYDVKMADDPEVFWGSVHKSITAITTLPLEFRLHSKRWLDERGWASYDDGELTSLPD